MNAKSVNAIMLIVNKTMGMSPKYKFSNQSGACADGNVIFLPTPDAWTDLDAYVRQNITNGLHECLHLLHTHFGFKLRISDSGSLWFSLLTSDEQRCALSRNAGCRRFVFNKALELQNDRRKNELALLRYKELCNELTQWKRGSDRFSQASHVPAASAVA